MRSREFIRHIIGYFIGFTVFVVGVPLLLNLLAWVFPGVMLIGNWAVRLTIGMPLMAVGVFFVAWSNLKLFLVGQGGPADGFNVAISPRTQQLVTVGPYRYTRNPMVFGALCVYFAVSILLDSAACLVFMLLFTYVFRVYLRLTEEKRLEKDFGDEYREYRQQVPMLFPRLFTRK